MRVKDLYCRECSEEAVYLDLKQEPSIYKVGASCVECNYDYGVLDRVLIANVDHLDEVFEIGEQSVKQLLETTE